MKPKAMVMAAGLGKRMRPLTDNLPKPLIRVAGMPLIDRTLAWLAASGVEEAVVNSHYLAPLIEKHLSTWQKPRLTFSHEQTLLETGGGIRKALPLLGKDAFFVVNSDILCIDGPTPVLSRLKETWDDGAMDALLLVHPVASAIGYEGPGDFFMEEEGMLRRRGTERAAPFVFTGVQLIHPRLFKDAPEGAFSLNVLYDRALHGQGSSPRLRAIIHDGNWLHVGDPEGLARAEQFFSSKR